MNVGAGIVKIAELFDQIKARLDTIDQGQALLATTLLALEKKVDLAISLADQAACAAEDAARK